MTLKVFGTTLKLKAGSLFLALLLSGCASDIEQPAVSPEMTRLQEEKELRAFMGEQLDRHLGVTGDAVRLLSETKQAAKPGRAKLLPSVPADFDYPARLDFVGPIEALLAELAARARWELRVAGKTPATRVIIDVPETEGMTGEAALRTTAVQAQGRAEIRFDNSKKQIWLRYGKS